MRNPFIRRKHSNNTIFDLQPWKWFWICIFGRNKEQSSNEKSQLAWFDLKNLNFHRKGKLFWVHKVHSIINIETEIQLEKTWKSWKYKINGFKYCIFPIAFSKISKNIILTDLIYSYKEVHYFKIKVMKCCFSKLLFAHKYI